MFCVHCGADGAETFCATCGRRQRAETQIPPERAPGQKEQRDFGSGSNDSDSELSKHRQPECWIRSLQYHVVLASPEPRERISAASRKATKGVTGDDLLAVFDAVSPIGISLGKLTHAILPLYDKIGIKIDRESQALFDAPPGRVILAVLCTLATKSLAIADVHQDSNRCSLSADLPWGLMTNPGKVHVLIMEDGPHVRVSLAVRISGQWYDFGKSKRLIDELFQLIQDDLTSQQSGRPSGYRRVA